ncbi:Gfo/Idh/MocA family protein [Agrococcus sp. SGAir0287]|uniref:Gfo/Idh/MocA family protein n=1 Tax=Agrococcus sp. SGAir0287 TaxID=2070347 RepID=UPI0010CD51F6|nr:Gfo/Idh/MocA family oxidoreductase [Agrococcus sp. SGAir0287]QCR19025.1 oxidoreductase [Agrococcus sp. SGAir0287]
MARRRLPAPRTIDPRDAPSLRWGILGPGGIASAMVEALQQGTGQQVVAVGGRSAERAAAFAQRHGIGASGDQDWLLAQDVDAIYVASPHSAHHAQALAAIDAGRAVLVEKAFTRNAGEAVEVLDAARHAGVAVAEAMWSRYLPGYDVVRRAVEEGVLGELRSVTADHGQLLWPDGPARLAEPALAGGALLDLGVYPIHLAAMLMPKVERVHAVGARTELGVDEQEVVTLAGPGGVLATCQASMSAKSPTTAVVAGTAARLELAGDFYRPTTIRLVAPDGEVLDAFEPDEREHGLRYEAVALARAVAAGERETPEVPWSETIRVMRIMDDVRAQLGVVLPGE